MAKNEGLQDRFGDSIRQGIATQAKAYQDYGALLARLASRDIKVLQFARDSADLYIGTMGKFASTGAKLAEDVMKAGMQGVDNAASATAEAVDEAFEKTSARSKASAAKSAPKAKRTAKKKTSRSAVSSKG